MEEVEGHYDGVVAKGGGEELQMVVLLYWWYRFNSR